MISFKSDLVTYRVVVHVVVVPHLLLTERLNRKRMYAECEGNQNQERQRWYLHLSYSFIHTASPVYIDACMHVASVLLLILLICIFFFYLCILCYFFSLHWFGEETNGFADNGTLQHTQNTHNGHITMTFIRSMPGVAFWHLRIVVLPKKLQHIPAKGLSHK